MFLSQKSTTLIVKQNKHKLFKLCENLQMIPLSKDTEASGGALSKDGAGRGSAGTQKSPLCIRHRTGHLTASSEQTPPGPAL